MSSRKLFDWLADQGNTKASRNQSERTCRTVRFPRNTRFEPSLLADGLQPIAVRGVIRFNPNERFLFQDR